MLPEFSLPTVMYGIEILLSLGWVDVDGQAVSERPGKFRCLTRQEVAIYLQHKTRSALGRVSCQCRVYYSSMSLAHGCRIRFHEIPALPSNHPVFLCVND